MRMDWAAFLVLIVNVDATFETPDDWEITPDDWEITPDAILHAYEEGVEVVGLENVEPVTLVCLFLVTNNDTYGKAAAANLAAIASDTKPAWAAADRAWNAPAWTRWNLSSSNFSEPARFSGCTDYGLPAFYLLKHADFEFGWTKEQEDRFKHMHQSLCYVWFAGAWNQGTWMGLGNTLMSKAYPETAQETTPWMYPYLSREQHYEKVYADYFDDYVMMEDADGYNQIWTVMMLAWPEFLGRQQQLRHPAVSELLGNFRDYVAPDERIFQFASGLGAHYASLDWVALFERAASLTGDGSFRFAAAQIYRSMLRRNLTIPSLIAHPSQGALFWPTTFGLLCGGISDGASDDGKAREAGVGAGAGAGRLCTGSWVNASIEAVPPPSYDVPSAVVHTRREVGDLRMPDKIVMAHSREYRSNRSYVTAEAHTGRSLFHSHAIDTSCLTNFWHGGARFLSSPGKHDMLPDHANLVVMQRGRVADDSGRWSGRVSTAHFPERNASDMYVPGQWGSLFLARWYSAITMHHYTNFECECHPPLAFVTLTGDGSQYLKRNFSRLGFTCDNWLNETVELTLLPVSLHGPPGGAHSTNTNNTSTHTSTHTHTDTDTDTHTHTHTNTNINIKTHTLLIDDFASSAGLWASPVASIVAEPRSASGSALRIVCGANVSSCGAPAGKPGEKCPDSCILDAEGWCQSVQTTHANRAPVSSVRGGGTGASAYPPLPTEIDPRNTVDVREFEAFNLEWRISSNYVPPPLGTPLFPIGMQTTAYPPFSNKTLTFFGNNVKQIRGLAHQVPALETELPTWAESIGGGEFWPIVSDERTTAQVRGEDLYARIEILRGYFTSGTATTRQIVALAEGPLVVVDRVVPDAFADGWVGGPSWAVTTGVDINAVHDKQWPAAWARPNITASGRNYYNFFGFQDVYSGALSGMQLLVQFPTVIDSDTSASTREQAVGVTESYGDHTCAVQQACPLYPAWYAHSIQNLSAGEPAVFVTVLTPHMTGTGDLSVLLNATSEHKDGRLITHLGTPNRSRVTVTVGFSGNLDSWNVSRVRLRARE